MAALGECDELGKWKIVTKKRMKAANINLMAKLYRKPISPVSPPPFQVREKAIPNCISQLPAPPGWQSTPEQTWEVLVMASNTEINEAELKWKVLNGKVKTSIADAGASSSCGRPEVSECVKYRLDSDPFIATSRKSDKIFQYAGGKISAADKIKQLTFKVREGSKDGHMIPGIQNNLLSTTQFSKTQYIKIFDEEEVNIYDATNTEIKTTKGAVLRGWRLPYKGLWRIQLDKNAISESNLNTKTVKAKEPLSKLLKIQPPTLSQSIDNVYKLKVKPELVRYYHAAAGFPTKPSWIAAINNKHYASWPRLDVTVMTRCVRDMDARSNMGYNQRRNY